MDRLPRIAYLIALAAGAVLACSVGRAYSAEQAGPPWVARGRSGMVASDSPAASRAGLQILRAGGNAVDAAIAVSLALSAARPESTGLGGGGFAVIYLSGREGARSRAQSQRTKTTSRTGRIVVLDFRETAPAAATAQMFVKARSRRIAGGWAGGPEPSRIGPLAVATPGVPAAYEYLLRHHATMAMEKLVAPALRIARRGFAVDEHLLRACRAAMGRYRRWPKLEQRCPHIWKHFLREGRLPKRGDIVKRPQLARILELMARKGPGCFYRGPVAKAIVAAAGRRAGGVLTPHDLLAYKPRLREPLVGNYRGYELVTAPPPAGGLFVLEALNIAEQFELGRYLRRNRPVAMHLLIEALRCSFLDRSRYAADADFADVPIGRLASKYYAAELASRLSTNRKSKLPSAGPTTGGAGAGSGRGGTSHFCVVDGHGNVVCWTETITLYFGSMVVAEPYGIILNNQMDDFAAAVSSSALSASPNAFGLLQSAGNRVGPNKRPASSMSPMILLKGGQAVLAVGASGGPRIISAVVQVIVDFVDGAEPLPEAVRRVRFHHQWMPDEVYFDAAPPKSLVDALRAMGHRISTTRKGAAVQAVFIGLKELVGVSDPRKGGKPAGW